MFENYRQLLAKIDAFVEGVMQRHPSSFECRPGCSGCCVAGITVWRVEADHISACKAGNASKERKGCTFLDESGRCTIYDARPVVCRLWGAPLLIPAGSEAEWGVRPSSSADSATGTITCCDLNFQKETKLDDLPVEDILNTRTAISTLAAINHLYCREKGLDPEERVELSSIL